MQSHNTIQGWTFARLQSERLSSGGGLLLFVSATMVLLAFIPLTPPVDAIKGGGVTARGMIEFGLILAGIFLMAGYARSQNLPWFDHKSPAFLLVSAFVFWAVMSSLWSVNPVLAIAKGVELWAVTMSAAMFVAITGRTHVTDRTHGEADRIEKIMAWSLVAVLVIAIFANIIFWGKLLPSSGDDSLPLYLMGEELPALAERPRLMLAYAHPLLTGDLLALSIVSLFVVPVNKALKATAIILLLLLLWMTDARGPTIALAAALVAMLVVKIRRTSVKATILALVISATLGIALGFQDKLLKPFQSLLTDDVYTLNSRTELWTSVFRHIAAQPITGYGYYASRYLLMKDFIWAGHAHNSLLEVLLTTGLVGLTIVGAYLAYVFSAIIRTRDCLLLGVAVYTLIQGMLNPLLFTPGLPMFVLTVALLNASLKRARASEGRRLTNQVGAIS
jgi:O-antigen ligase